MNEMRLPGMRLIDHERDDAVRVIDSHTAGEPTRVVLDLPRELEGLGPVEARACLDGELSAWARGVLLEPRGHDATVGALLLPSSDDLCVAGTVFFNDVGTLGMCGHGTIGLVETLRHLGRVGPGVHRLVTPVGVVEAELRGEGAVSVRNVPSRRTRAGVELDVPGEGRVRGDVAWGGNWFFIVDEPQLPLGVQAVPRLTRRATAIRDALARAGVTGDDGRPIDHVELVAPSERADARSFVLCPGGAYDRSPCGTGTSAKLACLHADGRLAPGQVWRQESIIGSRFEAVIEVAHGGAIIPRITGRAFVTAESTLRFDPADPFRRGIR